MIYLNLADIAYTISKKLESVAVFFSINIAVV